MASLSEENYLKAIYHLSKSDLAKVNVKSIASALNNAPASVVNMLKKLEDKTFVTYDKKTGVFLSKEGEKRALDIIRKHRLWEVFLLEKLEYSWDEIHDIAEQLEHIKDDQLADRLDKFLGFPEFDPHGDPIPTASGGLPAISAMLLSELKVGDICKISAIKNTEKSFLKYLLQLNLGIGSKIEIIDIIDFDKTMSIKSFDHTINVSKAFSDMILVDK